MLYIIITPIYCLLCFNFVVFNWTTFVVNKLELFHDVMSVAAR